MTIKATTIERPTFNNLLDERGMFLQNSSISLTTLPSPFRGLLLTESNIQFIITHSLHEQDLAVSQSSGSAERTASVSATHKEFLFSTPRNSSGNPQKQQIVI